MDEDLRKQELEQTAYRVVREALEKAGWSVNIFDWFTVFSAIGNYNQYEMRFEKVKELYGVPRPDFIAKLPSGSLCLIEVKGKSRCELIVDDRLYDSYIYWERFLNFPAFIVFYVQSETESGETRLYLHKVLDEDIRFGWIRHGVLIIDTKYPKNEVISLSKPSELPRKIEQLCSKWDGSRSKEIWKERQGNDLMFYKFYLS